MIFVLAGTSATAIGTKGVCVCRGRCRVMTFTQRYWTNGGGLAAILILSSLFVASLGQAAVFSCPSGNVGCLIDAINVANSNAEADEIYLRPGVYTLTEVYETDPYLGPTGLPTVVDDLSIVGNQTIIERDAGAPEFQILPKRRGALVVDGLTIRGGLTSWEPAAGGISSEGGGLTIRNCLITENEGWESGGVFSEGDCDVIIDHSTIRDNTGHYAGGVNDWCFWFVTSPIVRNSTIDLNHAYRTGGLVADGFAAIIDSTISRNTGESVAGGVSSYGGFAINSTISGNTGGKVGGITINPFGLGGLPPEMVMVNVILAGNEGGESWDDCHVEHEEGRFVSEGHNIIGNPYGCGVLRPNDIVGDPGLDTYTDNGTPGHGHYPLRGSSVAVDAANDGECSSTDQVGNPRHDGDGDDRVTCDIGAIEYQGHRIAIDIKPFHPENVIDLSSRRSIRVAVLSDSEFDPLQINMLSVRFGPDEAVVRSQRVWDINHDGLGDLVLRFRIRETGIECGDTQATLTGETFDGEKFVGTDSIRTVGCP